MVERSGGRCELRIPTRASSKMGKVFAVERRVEERDNGAVFDRHGDRTQSYRA